MIFKLLELTCFIPIRFPKTVITISVLLTLVSLVFIPRLHVTTDRNVILGTDNPIFKQREKINAMFGTPLVGIVIIKGDKNREDVFRAADEVANVLATNTKNVRSVFYRADVEFFKQRALLFLTEKQITKTRVLLERFDFPFDLIADGGDLADLVSHFVEQLDLVVPDDIASSGTNTEKLEAFRAYLSTVERWFTTTPEQHVDLQTEWATSLLGRGMQLNTSGYLTDNDGKNPPLAVLFVQPVNTSQSIKVVGPFTDLLRDQVRQATSKYQGMSSYVTGLPAMATDEMRIIRRDSVIAGAVAGIGVLLVFMLAFRSWRVGFFLLAPLGFGVIWTTGLAAILYGYLTMLTAYFAAILFGLGVAFTIHIIARYHEALEDGEEVPVAVRTSLVKSGPAVIVGGVTTVAAFLAILLSDFKGFAEMGVISATGVALILISNLTTLPAALVLWHPGKSAISTKSFHAWSGAFWVPLSRSRRLVPAVAIALAIAGVVVASNLRFDYALENLLPRETESVRGLNLLNERTDFTSSYTVAVANDIEEAERLRHEFELLSTTRSADALSQYLPDNQQARIGEIAKFSPQLGNQVQRAITTLLEHNSSSLTREKLAGAFQNLGDTLEDLAFDAKRAGRTETTELSLLSKKCRGIEDAIKKGSDDQLSLELEKKVYTLLKEALQVFASGLDAREFFASDLPEPLQRRFVSKDRRHYAVLVFPKDEFDDGDSLDQHINELSSVSKDVTGHVIGNHHFAKMAQRGFKNAVILASLAVLLLVLLDVRKPARLALALFPVVLAAGWTTLVMYLSDFRFNHANLMGLPILIGTAVDYGVHLAHRTGQEGSVVIAAKTTGKAIALSGLTTLIGFGSLILSGHWGMRSLGLLLVIGISSALVLTLIVSPGFFARRKTRFAQVAPLQDRD